MNRISQAGRILTGIIAGVTIFAVTGCGGKQQTKVRVPSAPTTTEARTTRTYPEPRRSETRKVETRRGEVALASPELESYAKAKPIYVETGIASWYGPPYHNRKAANGEVFDMHQLTAAHKTLPMNSVVRVTNLSNGKAALMRITDRGPF
ncbi:MAG: septal ring lytic transglycosylase RlpA family protein, partial [Terriglobales bacterium]